MIHEGITNLTQFVDFLVIPVKINLERYMLIIKLYNNYPTYTRLDLPQSQLGQNILYSFTHFEAGRALVNKITVMGIIAANRTK